MKERKIRRKKINQGETSEGSSFVQNKEIIINKHESQRGTEMSYSSMNNNT